MPVRESKKLMICSPSHNVHGGVERIVADLCRHLPRAGWAVALGLGRGERFNDVDRYRRQYPDLDVVSIDGRRGTRQARREALDTTLREVDADVVLIARMFDAYHAVSRLKRESGRPRLAVTVQAYEPHYFRDAALYREHIDLCVTSGELVRDALIEKCGLSERCVVSIPGGVEPPSTPIAPRRPGEILRLAYVGRLETQQKRIQDLPPFLDHLDAEGIRHTLDVVGTGPEEEGLRRSLRRRVDSGTVTFHGWQSRDALYGRFLPANDVLVHFAHTEGVTIAPREAMVHGMVPVISEFTGLKRERHFLNEHNALTFPVGDTAAAAAACRRLSHEPGLLRRLSENAMASQSGKYGFEGALELWADALDRCLSRPAATGPLPALPESDHGRLQRLGLPPWLAQRIRDLTRRRSTSADPGSEWPTGSGSISAEAAGEYARFARFMDGTSAEAAAPLRPGLETDG